MNRDPRARRIAQNLQKLAEYEVPLNEVSLLPTLRARLQERKRHARMKLFMLLVLVVVLGLALRSRWRANASHYQSSTMMHRADR